MEKHFTSSEIGQLEKRYKINLINSVSGYKSANLIGTIDESGCTNLCIVSSVIHLGSSPALLGFIMRPNTVPRHTYTNLKKNGQFTVNQVHEHIAGKAHFTSAKFEADESEFTALQLTEEFQFNFDAPFVKESSIKMALTLEEEHELSNGCILIVGKIQHLIVQESAITENGSLRLDRIDTVAISGLNKYYKGVFKEEYPYAKRDEINQHLQKKQKAHPDNVVFDQETNSYNAGLKKYNTNIGAPAIQHNDLGNWKRTGTSKVNHHLKTQFESIKKQYDDILALYEWNQKIYESKFNFEPTTGMTYHFYKSQKGDFFLSKISPDEWDKEYHGSFQLNADRIFIKVEEHDPKPTQEHKLVNI